MQIIEDEGYFFLTDIDSDAIKKFFDYLAQHQIKRAVIEMHSPGGALFDAQRIVGLMRYWQSRGIRIEIRLSRDAERQRGSGAGAAPPAGHPQRLPGNQGKADQTGD